MNRLPDILFVICCIGDMYIIRAVTSTATTRAATFLVVPGLVPLFKNDSTTSILTTFKCCANSYFISYQNIFLKHNSKTWAGETVV